MYTREDESGALQPLGWLQADWPKTFSFYVD